MEATTACGSEFLCFAGDLLERWERRDAARAAAAEDPVPDDEVECLPCLLQDWDTDAMVEQGE